MTVTSSTPVGLEGARADISEKEAKHINGFLPLIGSIVCFIIGPLLITFTAVSSDEISSSLIPNTVTEAAGICSGVIATLAGVILITTITANQPGETRVVTFFGKYIGTIRKAGFFATVPFSVRKKVTVRINNFETNDLKVNDADGNPINIAAIIVWQVADTAKAAFAVEYYHEFVQVQSEAALRHIASSYPYDNAADGEATLRGSTEQVARELASEVAERIALAGLEVVETRISTLAYAPEIAQAMLQRQQASAVIAAREMIVEGAVGMVENALDRLENQEVVTLDDERKAAMVSNLLVVLCSDSRATPVVNAGTLYN